jgi:multidrug efflux pump subunit AcrA (membrane-fusion protein)
MKKFIMILIVILLAAAFIVVPYLRGNRDSPAGPGGPPGGPGPGQRTSSTVFSVRTENAERRTLQAYIEVNANIVSANQVAVMPDANGRLVSMRVGIGDVVQRGALLAEVDPSRPGTDYSLSPVYAPVSGMVVTTPLSVGSTISTATPLMTIAVNNTIEIEALIPEREVGQLATGLGAEVRLEAFPGETFAATLTQLSPVVDPVSRTKKITLRFSRSDQRVSPGMFARIKLNTRTYPNVVSIPLEALVEYRGQTVVYALDAAQDTPRVQMREVVVGVTVDNEVEIKSGLNPGEAVVVQGQQFLSDGTQVRVIGGTSTGGINEGRS